MNKNINLCEILKGHEGETFYCSLFGNVKLHNISDNELTYQIEIIVDDGVKQALDKYGRFIINEHGECVLFPSKNQRDWNKWIKEQKQKQVPKTWNELQDRLGIQFMFTDYKEHNRGENMNIHPNKPIEKSALALLKIHQLIEVGYGGNITKEEFKNDEYKFIIFVDISINELNITSICHNTPSPIAFHTREQAKEFLSKPENVQLLKDYFMI